MPSAMPTPVIAMAHILVPPGADFRARFCGILTFNVS
jgi:hypothetical protein